MLRTLIDRPMSDSRTLRRLPFVDAGAHHGQRNSVPLFLTSSFRFDDAEHARALFTEEVSGNVYSRYAVLNTDEFVRKLCLLEGPWCRDRRRCLPRFRRRVCRRETTCSPRAGAVGSTHQIFTRILPKWGVESSYFDAGDQAQWIAVFARIPE